MLILLVGLTTSSLDEEDVISLTPWIFGVFEGLMILFVWLFSVRKYNASWRTLGFTTPTGRWNFALPWVTLLVGLVIIGIYGYIIETFNIEALEPQPIPGDSLGEGATRTLNILIIGLWGPFAEEIFFRGFLLTALMARFGPVRAVVVSAAIFAAAHIELGSLIPIFIIGLLLGWLYLKTRSLWLPIMAHALWNFIALVGILNQTSSAT